MRTQKELRQLTAIGILAPEHVNILRDRENKEKERGGEKERGERERRVGEKGRGRGRRKKDRQIDGLIIRTSLKVFSQP